MKMATAETVSPLVHDPEVRVVVVEDDDDVRDTLRAMLELNGYTVRTAADADSAAHLIETWRPVCVLLDLGLPDKALGLQLARELHRRFGPTLVIVVVTGCTAEEDLLAARQAGADVVLTKPLDARRLDAILHPVQ